MFRRIWLNLTSLAGAITAAFQAPISCLRFFQSLPQRTAGKTYASKYSEKAAPRATVTSIRSNPIRDIFHSHTGGPGIWKWEHYFDVYHRHFHGFIDRTVHILEIGVYSGGSLGMWKKYFGEKCEVIGVDIEPACKVYENAHTRIIIGDQQDRTFWRRVREEVPQIDIIIDDGGHTPKQQQVTLEELLPHLSPGGVYLCEDILGDRNEFSAFASSLVEELNCADLVSGGQSRIRPSALQKAVHSVHFYPFALVIEKNQACPHEFTAPRRGSVWQPFFDKTNRK